MKIDMTGRRYGRLLVVAEAGRNKYRAIMWLCRCDCGNKTTVRGQYLRSGHTTSCGCWKREVPGTWTLRHGESHTPLHNIWRCAIQRTSNPNHPDYHNYGARGIAMCPEWRESYEAFARDMGPTYQAGLTLDRIDVNRGYEPGNCRWGTSVEQGRNRRNNQLVTFDGKTMPVSAWAEHLGINDWVIRYRLRHGWSAERALTTPVSKASRPSPATAPAAGESGNAR